MKAVSPMVMRRMLRFGALAGVVLALLGARVVVSSRSELLLAERYQAEGNVDAAIVHYRRAARWYAPGSPFHRVALDKLAAIGRRADQRGDTETALSAYRAIRASLISARSFYTPEAERLKGANGRIADLMASLPPPPIDAGKSRERLRREHLALLETSRAPDPFWTCVLLMGFVGWIGGALVFATRAIDEENRLIGRQARRWGAVILVGFGLFVLGMALA